MLNEDDRNETINAHIVVNKIAIADLCKMFNSFLDHPIVPDTRYMLDKLFYPSEGLSYHAVCSNCKTYIKEYTKNDIRVHCEMCDRHINLKDPSYHDFFVVVNVKSQLKRLVEQHQEYNSQVMNDRERAARNNYEDFYDGRMYRDFVLSLPEDQRRTYLTVTFNSDGSPVFKSSKFSIRPIQINPNEVPVNVRNKRPLTYALWFGHDKPDMNIFLNPFVKGTNGLSEHGFDCEINNEMTNVKVYAL